MYDCTVETVDINENERIRIVRDDDCPDMPYNEYGYPVIRLTRHYYSREVETVYGQELAKVESHYSKIEDAALYFLAGHGIDDGLEYFKRWLAIFLDGRVAVTYSYDSATVFIAVNTPAMAEFCGTDTVEEPDLDEIKAWLNGEVYGIIHEQKIKTESIVTESNLVTGARHTYNTGTDSWEECDSYWGFYGYKDVLSEAEAWAENVKTRV